MKKFKNIGTILGVFGIMTIGNNNVKAESTEESDAVFSLEAQDENGGGTAPLLSIPPTGNKGPLTIDGISSFIFPNAKISGNSMTIVGESQKVNNETGVMGAQITDSRGSGDGWTLKAKITDFIFKESEEENATSLTLKGAVMSLPQGEVITSETAISDIEKPTSSTVSLNSSNQKILVAKKGAGLGVWAVNFEKNTQGIAQKEVKLYVPAGNFKASYKATISWTLTEAPE